jgi:hypothetical protein
MRNNGKTSVIDCGVAGGL